jgi:hypothetical protein
MEEIRDTKEVMESQGDVHIKEENKLIQNSRV